MSVDFDLKEVVSKIEVIKEATLQLKQHSHGIQAIDRNVERILASVKMLEINFSDPFNLVDKDES